MEVYSSLSNESMDDHQYSNLSGKFNSWNLSDRARCTLCGYAEETDPYRTRQVTMWGKNSGNPGMPLRYVEAVFRQTRSVLRGCCQQEAQERIAERVSSMQQLCARPTSLARYT
ncbi:unnamed protein product [Pieris macdunnoughi]|uniref:Uncharacterized protein n=1 Tax=Pieris macdunnoughi TaxID=345717 RepID=A0A821QU18_9NEOP|nr:unnamed protein product [Pieris macdunnoughi]